MLKHKFSVEQTWNINTANNIKSNVNNPVLLESRLGRSFPEKKFLIMGYGASYRVDRNCYRERLMLFAREETQLSVLSVKNTPIGRFYFELNLPNKKSLFCGSYLSHRNTIEIYV